MAARASTAGYSGEKEYHEYLELTENEKHWISEQISGWTRKEWSDWFLTLSPDDQEWWERAAASHPKLFEQPAALDPGLALDSVGVEESIMRFGGFGIHLVHFWLQGFYDGVWSSCSPACRAFMMFA